jgi:hypothetical protein
MTSVTSVNSGIGDLLRIFVGPTSSPLSSVLSTAPVQSALQSASITDVVQISEQALQLQQASGLFGNSGSSSAASQPSTDPGTLALQALDPQSQPQSSISFLA